MATNLTQFYTPDVLQAILEERPQTPAKISSMLQVMIEKYKAEEYDGTIDEW